MGMDRAQQVPGLVSMWGMCGLGHKSAAAAAFWILAIGWQHIGTQAQIHGGENQPYCLRKRKSNDWESLKKNFRLHTVFTPGPACFLVSVEPAMLIRDLDRADGPGSSIKTALIEGLEPREPTWESCMGLQQCHASEGELTAQGSFLSPLLTGRGTSVGPLPVSPTGTGKPPPLGPALQKVGTYQCHRAGMALGEGFIWVCSQFWWPLGPKGCRFCQGLEREGKVLWVPHVSHRRDAVGHEGHYDADIGALAMQSWQPVHDSQHRDVEEHLTRGDRAGCFLLSHPLHIGSKYPWPACPRDMSGRAQLFSPSQPAWKASNSDLELDRVLCTRARQTKQAREKLKGPAVLEGLQAEHRVFLLLMKPAELAETQRMEQDLTHACIRLSYLQLGFSSMAEEAQFVRLVSCHLVYCTTPMANDHPGSNQVSCPVFEVQCLEMDPIDHRLSCWVKQKVVTLCLVSSQSCARTVGRLHAHQQVAPYLVVPTQPCDHGQHPTATSHTVHANTHKKCTDQPCYPTLNNACFPAPNMTTGPSHGPVHIPGESQIKGQTFLYISLRLPCHLLTKTNVVQLLRGQTLLCETKRFLLGFASSSAIPGGKEGLSLHLHHKFENNPYTGKCSQSTIICMGWMQKAQCWLSALHSCDQRERFSSWQLTCATPRQKRE
ncbi:hypothetical protein Anapl_14821 [Anas platyrhynchos]|uniref:Uncharacterized protein n=1 Tax=Anas platyrhynchos TaxID=8839 RepID=R0L8H1_ANAPL|nr:hypothetical protein Anapl_14821 [Anas platyrhynchos]